MKFRKPLKIGALLTGVAISGTALAMIIPLHFPITDILAGQTLSFRGYEQFKAKVNGKTCKASSKKNASELTIRFIEQLQPGALQIDGYSGASTRAKQQDEIMRRFRIGGLFQITQINGTDQTAARLTGSYSGHTQLINLKFNQPQTLSALFAERQICQGLTNFNVAEDNRGTSIYSATLQFNGKKQTGTLTLNSQIVDADNPQNVGQYKVVFQTIQTHQ